MSELQPFNFNDAIKTKMQKLFIDIVPEDQWEQMLKAQMTWFFEKKPWHYSSDPMKPSDFEVIVTWLMSEKIKEEAWKYIEENLSSMEWNWDKIKLNSQIQKMIAESLPWMFENILWNMVQTAINNARYN